MAARRKPSMWTAERIKLLRKRYGQKQDDFCKRLRVCVGALRDWEQGRGTPVGPAQELLDRLEEEIDQGRVRTLASA